jgi:hypothetical protein
MYSPIGAHTMSTQWRWYSCSPAASIALILFIVHLAATLCAPIDMLHSGSVRVLPPPTHVQYVNGRRARSARSLAVVADGVQTWRETLVTLIDATTIPRSDPHVSVDRATPSYASAPSNYTLVRHGYFAWPYAPSAYDSLAESILISGRYGEVTTGGGSFSYHLCVFRNVCVAPDGIYFHFGNRTLHQHYTSVFDACDQATGALENIPKGSVCACFNKDNRAMLMPFDEEEEEEEGRSEGEGVSSPDAQARSKPKSAARTPRSIDAFQYMAPRSSSQGDADIEQVALSHDHHHYFALHGRVASHDIYHWSEKLLHMQAALQHFAQIRELTWLTEDATGSSEGYDVARLLFPPIPRSSPSYIRESYAATDSDADFSPITGERLFARDPPFTGLVFPDSHSDVSEHELTMMRMSVLSGFGSGNLMARGLLSENETFSRRIQSHAEETGEQRAQRVQRVLRGAYIGTHLLFRDDLEGGHSRTDLPRLVAEESTEESLHRAGILSQKQPWSTCFSRLTFSPTVGAFTSHTQDLVQWRENALQHLGIMGVNSNFPRSLAPEHVGRGRLADMSEEEEEMSVPTEGASSAASMPSTIAAPRERRRISACPGRRVLFLTGPSRSILNRDALLDAIRARYRGVRIDVASMDDTTPSQQQAELFASAGMIMGSHSPMWMNTVFMHPGACVIEVSPYYWSDSDASGGAGVMFRYAFGGDVVAPSMDEMEREEHIECIRALKETCQGDGGCIHRARCNRCKRGRSTSEQHADFHADTTEVARQVHGCVQHLNWQCYGEWTP